MSRLCCPWCSELFTVPSGSIKVCPNPDCGKPILIVVQPVFESGSTIPVPNRPIDYIQNPQNKGESNE